MADTFTDNLRIAHLQQNVAQPEIPENTAKNIIDSLLSNVYVLDFLSDADVTITHVDDVTQATDWQSFMIEMTDTNPFLTIDRNVILPDNTRPYIFKNSTLKNLTFKTAAGTGVLIGQGQNAYCFSDGTNIEKLEFAPTGSGSKLESMTDTPTGYGSANGVLISNGSNAFTYYDLTQKMNHTGATITDYGETSQAPTSATGALEIDLASGNVVSYEAIENTVLTLTTTHTNTSFTMRATNLGAYTIDFQTNQTVEWEGKVKPTFTVTGVDLITFTKIGSIWTAGALLNIGVPA